MQVLVRENNVDQALKALKKKMNREDIIREMKLRQHHEKPSVRRAREKPKKIRLFDNIGERPLFVNPRRALPRTTRIQEINFEPSVDFAGELVMFRAIDVNTRETYREKYREALKRICEEEEG